MSERRCPNCGALVAADAQWCSLCFHTLVEPAEEPESPLAPAAAAGGPPPPPPPAGDVDPSSRPAAGSVPPPPPVMTNGPGSTATTDAGGPVTPGTWTCPNCGEVNPLDEDHCLVCGTAFLSLFQHADRPDVSRHDAIARSLLYPGLGHALLGRSADGLARGVLFTWALGTVLLLLLSLGDRAAGLVLGMTGVYLIVALGIYVLSALEAGQLADGGRLFVSSRGLAWFSAGLVIITLLLAFLLITASSGKPADDTGPQDTQPVIEAPVTLPLNPPTASPSGIPEQSPSGLPSVTPSQPVPGV